MTQQWTVSNPPKASLIPVDKEPREVVQGYTVQRFTTARTGAWWAQVVEPGGFTYWMRLVTEG